MEKPERYGYNLAPVRIYKPIKCDTVQVRNSVPFHITDVAHALGTDFKTLKELNPHILGYYLPTGRYKIKVPHGMGSKLPAVLKKFAGKVRYRQKKLSGNYYVVQPGDTLTHISKRTGVPVATLKKINGISGSLIMVGQKLRISP
ncbi:LysM peptidoglycan-binding domain-containing protein, partial [Thermodesulfobacteriota bacterium]